MLSQRVMDYLFTPSKLGFRRRSMRHFCNFTLILLGLAALGCSPAIVQAEEGKEVDLPSCAWQASPGAHVAIHGDEIDLEVTSLPQSAPRTMECWVALPASRPMVVQGLHHGAVTESGWTFTFERSTGERRQLYQGSQERQFTFPVPAEWEHDPRVGIVIGIPGDNPGYLHLQNLRLQPAADVLPGLPEPISPAEGQEVTPPAADFLWACPPVGSVVGYTLEWQREGEEAQQTLITAYFRSDAQGFWPHQWLSTGRYSWRVRALNAAGRSGPWSGLMHFTVRQDSAARPPDIDPSAGRPVTILDLPVDDIRGAWELVPPDVRPTFLFRTGGPRTYIAHILAAAQAAGAPIALQVNGPHNIIAGRWDRVPLALLAQWAHDFPCLKAFYICEQQVQGGVENSEVTGYLERLIALGQETGRPVFWADANWGGNIWLDVEAHRDIAQFLKTHYGYVYPLWKMNGGDAPYLAPAGLLGLWLSHTVAAWGVQPESYYWTEAGFTTLGTQLAYKEGVRQDAPLVVFQELALLGASAGAEIYSFEPGIDFWGTPPSHAGLVNVIWPLFRLLKDGVIPGLSAVQAATVMTHGLEPPDLVFRSEYTDPMRQLFARTLGMAYPSQMVPESGSCYWIPFVPAAAGSAAGQSLRAVNTHSGPAEPCPPPVPGKAAVFRVGQATYVFNSRVNWPGEQAFSIRLAGAGATGKLGTNGWVTVLNEANEQAHLWFFARKDSRLEMEFSQPIIWRNDSGQVPSAGSGRASQAASAATRAWSRPLRSLELSADQRPWNIVIHNARAVPTQ
jgi:hypothetical protein